MRMFGQWAGLYQAAAAGPRQYLHYLLFTRWCRSCSPGSATVAWPDSGGA